MKKKPPLRVDELKKIREDGGIPCTGFLNWEKRDGLLLSKNVNNKKVYSYKCLNCHYQGTTENESYRAKCGRKLT